MKVNEANDIQVIRADQRHFADMGWLQTFWLFSFAEYYDPENLEFGTLRVFNDDFIAAGKGFPTHPHVEMEIVTIVLEGELTHKDSMGHEGVIRPNEVQRMSAGTGLMHSEFNLSDRPVHLYQIWIRPNQAGMKPSYEQKAFDPADWRNRLCPVASGEGIADTVAFHAEATLYRGDFDKGGRTTHEVRDGRGIFIYVTDGQLRVNDIVLTGNDQARVTRTGPLMLEAVDRTGLILIDVPAPGGA